MMSLLYYKIRVRISSNITLISNKNLGYKPVFKNKIKKENRVYWTKAFISLAEGVPWILIYFIFFYHLYKELILFLYY